MTKPRATIAALIPAYNQERFLGQALESVFAQTQPADEVIVVDDASTDATAAIAARFPVQVIRRRVNGSAGVARNSGLAVATATWIANLDADDWWHPTHLEVLRALVTRAPEAVVAFSEVAMVGPAVPWPRSHPTERPFPALGTLLYANQVPQSASMMRRDIVGELGGYDPAFRICHDYDLWVRMATRGPFIASAQVTASYRWHDGQLSQSRAYLLLEDLAVRAKSLITTPEASPPVGPSRAALVRRWEDLLMETWEASGPLADELLRMTAALPWLRTLVGIRLPLWSRVIAHSPFPRGVAATVARTVAWRLRPNPADWPPRPPTLD